MFKFLLAAIFNFFIASCAFADGMLSISQLGCGFLDGRGNHIFKSITLQITSSDNQTISCLTNLVNFFGRRVRWEHKNTGYLCNTKFGLTDDWYEEVDSLGNVNLTCNRKNIYTQPGE